MAGINPLTSNRKFSGTLSIAPSHGMTNVQWPNPKVISNFWVRAY